MTTTNPLTLVPFSPLTDVGLSIAIETHGSVVTCAIGHSRHLERAVIDEATLVLAMCRARTDRIIHARTLAIVRAVA